MDISGTEITGHRISFCVLKHEGKPIQHLTIIPVAFLDYHGNWEGNYIMVKIHLEIGYNNHCIVDDHITVGSLIGLHDLLVGFQHGVLASEKFGTVDGQLEFTAEWRPATCDVGFIGRIPSFDYSEILDEPLLLRKGIYRIISFQFALEPGSLSETVGQLANLLEWLRSVRP